MKSATSRARRKSSPATHRRVPAVTRALAILRLLGKSESGLGVNAIALELKLVPSTCLHILRVLVGEGLVALSSGDKRYRLDAGVLTLARSLLKRNGFGSLVQRELDALANSFPVTAVAVQHVNLDHIVVVAIAGSQLEGRIHVEVGGRFPALMSATGRCVAAFGGHPPDQIRAQFKKVRWDRAPSLKTWTEQVEVARKNHYSVDVDNYISGLTVIASPILDDGGRMTHAVVCVGVTKQIQKVGFTRIAEDLRSAARRVSKDLMAPSR
jgi:DNA-binding IclR family transcriptional regulator